MRVTRDVIRDLLPAYLAGETSADTRDLIAEFLLTDPALASEFEAARAAEVDLGVVPRALPADHELATLHRTKRLLRLRTWLLAGGIFFAALPGSFVFSGSELVWLMARDCRPAAAASLLVATVCWAGYGALAWRLRVRGL